MKRRIMKKRSVTRDARLPAAPGARFFNGAVTKSAAANALFALLLIPAFLAAQDTVAPSVDEKVGPLRGENAGNYNVVQSWELGYRFVSTRGDQGKYRSDVNYHDGVRLLGSSLTVNSKDGRGRWFDEIVLTAQGLGNDPYESATIRVEKNRLYRYDLLWRENDYFNPGLTVASGQHLEDTIHRWQDHDLTLFPQSWFRVRAGYSRATLNGPALTTQPEFDPRTDIFPIFRNIRQSFDDYRLGGDLLLKGFRLTIQRRWEFFKEDTKDNQIIALQGIAPEVLSSFQRPQPYRGRTPGWLANLYGERKWLIVNARVTYAGGQGTFVQNENAVGTDRFGAAQNRQIIVLANGDRPVTTGDFNLTLLPAGRFSIINHTSASNTRIVGSNFYEQFDNATFSYSALNFQFLGVRLVTNSTDARFRFSKKFDLFGGFRYSDRLIRSIEDSGSPGFELSGITAEQSNHTKAGAAGFNAIPVKNLRVHFEGEIGRNDDPFTPASLRNYHAIRSKIQYRTKTLALGGGYQENYNNNSIRITAYSSHARTYTAEASWNAKSWVSVDASWSKLHLDTVGGVNFFAGAPRPTLVTGLESIYLSNLHAANLGLRFAATKRADLYLGYNITKDTGDGRASAFTSPTSLASAATSVAGIFSSAQTFPLTYQTPLVRLSVRLNEKLRWNLGYQYYGYHEQFGLTGLNQGYRANTGYSSLLWAF